jgi:chromate reductase
MTPKLLALAGSLRAASFNRKLLTLAVDRARHHGAEVEVIDLRELAVPLYDGDVEASAGLPSNATALRDRIRASHGVVLASPEYNASLPGTVKNLIDWISRPPDQPLRGRTVQLLAATSGPGAGRRVLFEWRTVFSALGMFVMPGTVGLARAGEAFDDHGALKDAAIAKQLDTVMSAMVDVTRKLGS